MPSETARVADLGEEQLAWHLKNSGLTIQIGPAALKIRTPATQVHELLALLYCDFPLASESVLIDAELHLLPSRGVRRWTRPRVHCLIDGRPPFEPLPWSLAYPMMEWSMNWCLASRLHRYFMIHAAVVARNDQALILPAWSGSGKSTLCAALVARGWRLLSDEFCLLDLTDGRIYPSPRPIPLKNEAIAAFRAFSPETVMGPTFYQTRKGDIAHLRPPRNAVLKINDAATPAWIVLPRYRPDGDSQLEPISATNAMLLMAANSFNFNLLGTPAFDALSRMMKTVTCHRIFYSDLGAAVQSMETLPS